LTVSAASADFASAVVGTPGGARGMKWRGAGTATDTAAKARLSVRYFILLSQPNTVE